MHIDSSIPWVSDCDVHTGVKVSRPQISLRDLLEAVMNLVNDSFNPVLFLTVIRSGEKHHFVNTRGVLANYIEEMFHPVDFLRHVIHLRGLVNDNISMSLHFRLIHVTLQNLLLQDEIA